MSSWFIILNLFLLLSSSFVQTRSRAHSKRRYPVPTAPFIPPFPVDDNSVYAREDDSLIEFPTTKTPLTTPTKHLANEQQMAQFTLMLIERLNLKEAPNVTIPGNDATGIPSILQQLEKENIQRHEEIHSNQRQKNREDIQATTERAILPGDSIPHHTCRRQIAAKLHLSKENLHHIGCFRFTKSTSESKSLPTNQIIKQLRIYVRKNYFFLNKEQEQTLTPDMFQIYQVFRPTANDTLQSPLPGLTDTSRLSISQIKQLNRNWFELTVDPNNGPTSIQQIYQQSIMPWYGLAINHALQSSWSTFYRRYYSKKNLENFLRSDDEEMENKESQQQLPYMLVEYGERMTSSGRRGARQTGNNHPAQACHSKSTCCRRPLTIDLDQGSNALNFVIYPRKLDIGECIGVCGISGSSLKHTEAKNAQHQNQPHSGYGILALHQNGLFYNRSTTTTQVNKPDQQSAHCCSYSRTGGIEVMYTTTNGGPIIRKFLPNMVVEQCRCGLPATIQQL